MRRIRQHLTYSNVMVTILAFIVLTGGTAVALSGTNRVFTDDIANDTQPAGGENPAGGLAAADLRPGSVGSSEAANNSLTGADVNESTLAGFIRGRTLDLNLDRGDPRTLIATVGPYRISGQCADAGGVSTELRIHARGPAGLSEAIFSLVENDTTDLGNFSRAETLSANVNTIVVSFGSDFGFIRGGGTIVLRSSSGTIVQVDFSAAVSATQAACHIWGTATTGT